MSAELIHTPIDQPVWYPGGASTAPDQARLVAAQGSYLTLSDGHQLIDGTSSWWCKSLGHGHPRLRSALEHQLDRFEHVMLANLSHDVIEKLSQRLAALLKGPHRVFYASDGASAVEIAMKMSVHSRLGQGDRHRFIALKGGYHGETIGALSVTHASRYRKPYTSMLFDTTVIDVPEVTGIQDPLWSDASEHWEHVYPSLLAVAEQTTAIILEPLWQGAGGMRLYSADFLSRLGRFARDHNIHLIADEIMTGLGRTGRMLACEYANIQPDIVCLGKGLTSGWMPMSAVIAADHLFEALRDHPHPFVHSHTYTGHALGASVAGATLDVLAEDHLVDRAQSLEAIMRSHMQFIAEHTGRVHRIRALGALVAADLVDPSPETAQHVAQAAFRAGALLRPIGRTIYWMPPLNVSEETLLALRTITQKALMAHHGGCASSILRPLGLGLGDMLS